MPEWPGKDKDSMSQTMMIPENDAIPHDEWGLLMSLALDGLLDGDEQQRLDRHLTSCEPCQQQWQIWQTIDDSFQAPPWVMPSVDFAQKVDARIEAVQTGRERRVAWALALLTFFVWAAGFAGTGVLFTLLIYNGVGWFAETIQWLSSAWRTLTAVATPLWGVLVGLSQNPNTVGLLLGYLALALVMLTAWGYLLRRSLRPFEAGVA